MKAKEALNIDDERLSIPSPIVSQWDPCGRWGPRSISKTDLSLNPTRTKGTDMQLHSTGRRPFWASRVSDSFFGISLRRDHCAIFRGKTGSAWKARTFSRNLHRLGVRLVINAIGIVTTLV